MCVSGFGLTPHKLKLNDRCESLALSSAHPWELIVAHKCSKVFLASKYVVVFQWASFACSFLIRLVFLLWACIEITHNAQPRKLTGSCTVHGVIRWRQRHSPSSQYQDHPSQRLWAHASVFPCVLYQHDSTLRKMPTTCWYLTPLPPCLCVTSSSAQARITPLLSGVLLRDTVYNAFTAYMPYGNAKCCLIFVLFSMFIVHYFNLALPLTCRDSGQVLKK